MSVTTYQEVYRSKKGQSVILNSDFLKKGFTDDICLNVINQLNTGQIQLYKKKIIKLTKCHLFFI